MPRTVIDEEKDFICFVVGEKMCVCVSVAKKTEKREKDAVCVCGACACVCVFVKSELKKGREREIVCV